MSLAPDTTDVRPELRRYVGDEVAVAVSTGSLRIVGHGVMSLIDDNVKAVRVGDTTLTFDTWQVCDVSATNHGGREPWMTIFRMTTGAHVALGWHDVLVSDYEE